MTKPGKSSARSLERSPVDQLATSLRRFQRGGRTGRRLRRAAAIVLLLAAGALAVKPDPNPAGGRIAIGVARDLPIGATLTDSDLTEIRLPTLPDGAIRDLDDAVGRSLAAPIRRGEVLTDLRLVDDGDLRPGAGRTAVPVTLPDPEVAGLLRPGMSVAVVAIHRDPFDSAPQHGTALAVDAVVLAVIEPDGGGLGAPSRDRTIVLAVPADQADAVAAAALSGALTIRFR